MQSLRSGVRWAEFESTSNWLCDPSQVIRPLAAQLPRLEARWTPESKATTRSHAVCHRAPSKDVPFTTAT